MMTTTTKLREIETLAASFTSYFASTGWDFAVTLRVRRIAGLVVVVKSVASADGVERETIAWGTDELEVYRRAHGELLAWAKRV